MLESCHGGPYASMSLSPLHGNQADSTIELNVLVVDPKYQRQGIGSKLLEDGLNEVDRRGLQCVLGASRDGYVNFLPPELLILLQCDYLK